MWISKVRLVAFKSYQNQEFVFPEPADGKNIVLIGGLNGYGKTSFLEALYLCLYGKDSIVHLARAGIKSDNAGYPTFLESAFNREAFRDGLDTMTVKVEISESSRKSYEITRKWYFRNNGTWNEEEALFNIINNKIPETPKIDGKDNFHLQSVLDDILIPSHVAPFFFFDGEEVKKLADQSRIEQVKAGLEQLLGVGLLRALSDRLKNFESQRRSEYAVVDETHLDNLANTISANDEKLKIILSNIQNFSRRKNELIDLQDSLIDRLSSVGGATANQATFKDLVEERKRIEIEAGQIQDKVSSLLTDKLPLQLVSIDLRTNLADSLLAEVKLNKWEQERSSLQPRQIEFEKALLTIDDPKFEPELTVEQQKSLLKRVSSAWALLFFPPPSDCADEIYFHFLSDQDRLNSINLINNLRLTGEEFLDLQKKLESHTLTIDKLSRDIHRLEGIGNDGTFDKLRKELDDARDELNLVNENISNEERHKLSLESNISKDRASFERSRKLLDDSSPKRALIEKSARIRNVISNLIPALFPLKVQELADSMTSVYKRLAHKDQISEIKIDNDGTTTIIGKSGKPIEFDRSAGENQIFATALIAALAEVSKVSAPLVVDTPLGRLDSKHRQNIVDFWMSDKGRQVILLSQDKEIDIEFASRISNAICSKYLLEHIEVGDGIGRTSAIMDAYFGDKK